MDKSREQFEAWFGSEVFSNPNLANCYWDAWQASREAMQIPDGWVLVPKKLTGGITEAMTKSIDVSVGGYCESGHLYESDVQDFYNSILEAAPKPE